MKRPGEYTFARGATLRRGPERVDVPVGAVAVVDSTGAGDAFDAGFVAGWLNGLSLRGCGLLGSACGTLTTRYAEGFNGQPTWDEAVSYVRAALNEAVI